MRRTILIGTMLAAALATGASAQTAQTPKAGSTERTAATEVKVTGCLRPADASPANKTAGTAPAATAGSPSLYVLTDATTPPDTKAATSYQLAGGNRSDLEKYVNSKVEVLATLATSNSNPASPSTGATSGSTGTAGATGSGAIATRETGTSSTMPTLQVRSIRQVASSCMP